GQAGRQTRRSCFHPELHHASAHIRPRRISPRPDGGERLRGEGTRRGEEGQPGQPRAARVAARRGRPGLAPIGSDKNRERLDIHVEKVDGSQAHELWVEDPADSGLFTQTNTLDGNGGSLSLKLDTKKGDPLPLDALNTDALVGRHVE